MVGDDGRVVLMDFGDRSRARRHRRLARGHTSLPRARALCRRRSPSAASDVYSLAVLLHRLLTGSYPVSGTDVRDLRHAHERGERTKLHSARPDLPAKFASAIDRALDPDPARRLRAWISSPPSSRRRAVVAARPPVRRLGVAAAVLLVLGAGWEIRGRRSERRSPLASACRRPGLSAREPSPATTRVAEPTLVVLPFDNLGEGTEGDSFADGLADEIIRDLARVDGLAVRSRYSSFTFRDRAARSRRHRQAAGREPGGHRVGPALR